MTLDTRKHVSQMSDKEITGILQFVKLNYNKFELSNHAIEKCNKKNIPLFWVKNSLSDIENIQVIEYHENDNCPTILIRNKFGENNVCLALSINNYVIKTVYSNKMIDNHETIDMAIYTLDKDLTKVFPVIGYHTREIIKGKYGEPSKIKEELEEYEDAIQSGIVIMAMWELSDIYGALEGLAKKHNLTMDDLKAMSDKNKLLFTSGVR